MFGAKNASSVYVVLWDEVLPLAIHRLTLMHKIGPFSDPYWWTVGLASIVQFVLFLRWLYRRIRNDELTRVFVQDMAMNHLPHIYVLLEKLCDQQGIGRSQIPPIRWIDLNNRES